MTKRFIAIEVGCLECEGETIIRAFYDTQAEAEAALPEWFETYGHKTDGEPRWQRPPANMYWSGQAAYAIFDTETLECVAVVCG